MSAKTKAKQLISNMSIHTAGQKGDQWNAAKRCAKIAVDEILSLLTLYNPDNAFNDLQTKKFWHDVKNEIDLS